MEDDEYKINISTTNDLDTITISTNRNDSFTDLSLIDNTWYTITNTIDSHNIIISDSVEFEDSMPEVAKIENMCRDYPALEKAYENFKTVYKMVHQDWKGRQDDEPPF